MSRLDNAKTIIWNPTVYDKAKRKGTVYREHPVDEKKHRWIVEMVDLYEDGTEIIANAVECDLEDLAFVQYCMIC